MKAPCKDCVDRHLHCHSECNKYLEFKRDRDNYLKETSKEQQINIYQKLTCERIRNEVERKKKWKRKG